MPIWTNCKGYTVRDNLFNPSSTNPAAASNKGAAATAQKNRDTSRSSRA